MQMVGRDFIRDSAIQARCCRYVFQKFLVRTGKSLLLPVCFGSILQLL